MTATILIIGACLLLAMTVVLLARNRWIQSHPLRACVVLSVVAHILLLAVICVTNIFKMPVLPPGDGAIMVKLEPLKPSVKAAAPRPPAKADRLAPKPASEVLPSAEELESLREAIEKPAHTPVDLVAESAVVPVKTEERVPAPFPTPTPSPEPPAVVPPHELAALPVPDVGDAQPTAPHPAVAASETAQPPKLAPVPPSVSQSKDQGPQDGKWEHDPQPRPQRSKIAGRGSRYAGRSPEGRARETVVRGGSAKTEAAVRAALDWLASAQAIDGRWDASVHGSGRGGVIERQLRGRTGVSADTGVTALALLAFLAHGETHQEGKYAGGINRALQFLIASQRPNGDLGGRADVHAHMYCHGMATLALAEAYAMSEDPNLIPPLRRAIAYSLNCQDRHTGGWRYRPGEAGDTSQFGWQVMALTSAGRAGIRDGDVALAGMRRFLGSVSSGSAGGLASYRPGSAPTRSMTAEALACRWCLGDVDMQTLDEASGFIMQQPPGAGTRNFYYWYYATLALCQLDAPAWSDWNRALQRELLRSQRRRGDLKGSWDPTTVWGPCGGRVYTTAIGALCLEVYYRYAPRAEDIAERSIFGGQR